MVLKYQNSSRILSLGFSGTICMCLAYIIAVLDPVEKIISDKLSLKNGSFAFSIWQQPPYEVLLSVYIFNVTNGEAFIRGDDKKLIVNEVGPYVYQEYLENTNTQFNDNGTLSFIPKRRVEFRPDRSIGDPTVDRIISTNIPLLGIVSALHDSSIFTNLALNSMVAYLDSQQILNLTVDEFLWGYDDLLVKYANTLVPNWITFPRFGILERMFSEGENTVTMNVNTKIKPSTNPLVSEFERSRPYSIQLWNGSPGLAPWGYKDAPSNVTIPTNTRCNTLEGAYDGTIFPRHINTSDTFHLYRKAFCRTLPIIYNGTGYSSEGFKGYKYRLSPDFYADPMVAKDSDCYCLNKDKCLPAGLSDLTSCYYQIPIAVSMPHFLNCDKILFEKIEGLFPDDKKHSSELLIHPSAGIPIRGHSRIQVNLVVSETQYSAKVKPFNGLTIPLTWFQMSVEKLPTNVAILIGLIDIAPYIQIGFVVLLAIGGFVMFILSLYKFIKLQNSRPGMPLYERNITYTPVKVVNLKEFDQFVERETII